MTWPTVAVNTANMDAGTDNPATARTDILDAITKLNQLMAHVSGFAATLLDDVDAAAVRTTLGAAPLASPALTGAPTAPTPAGLDNDTSVATTAFVQGELTSQAVKLTGAQTVAGVKTLSNTPVLSAGATFGSATMTNPSGTAPVFGARAWCTFNGTTAGTNAPLSGGNVTSVTRNGTGDYTINLATALPDADYAITGNCKTSNIYVHGNSVAKSASSPRVGTSTGSGAGALDDSSISVVIYR